MGSGDPWPSRPNVNETGMNQNVRQLQVFSSLVQGLLHTSNYEPPTSRHE